MGRAIVLPIIAYFHVVPGGICFSLLRVGTTVPTKTSVECIQSFGRSFSFSRALDHVILTLFAVVAFLPESFLQARAWSTVSRLLIVAIHLLWTSCGECHPSRPGGLSITLSHRSFNFPYEESCFRHEDMTQARDSSVEFSFSFLTFMMPAASIEPMDTVCVLSAFFLRIYLTLFQTSCCPVASQPSRTWDMLSSTSQACRSRSLGLHTL